MDLRSLEKTDKFGYLFYISYNGIKFDAFDSVKEKYTVKGEFEKRLKKLGITWAKGIQQAGRTDAKVSAKENILYISSNNNFNFDEIIEKFNNFPKELKLNKIEKTLPKLIFPEEIKAREYIYKFPVKKIKVNREDIIKNCEKYSGKYDVSIFTDFKGSQLKEKIRSVEVNFKEDTLYFSGSSFMPKQVRIMSGFLLTGEKKILPGKYLSLSKIILSYELKNNLITEVYDIIENDIEKIEKIRETFIFYVKKEKKGEIIGTRGRNIKKLRKKYGSVIIKEIVWLEELSKDLTI